MYLSQKSYLSDLGWKKVFWKKNYMQQNTSVVLALLFSHRKIHTHPCTHNINIVPKSRISFFLLSFLTFLFSCIVHCFFSGAQETFLFPTPSIPPPNHAFLLFSLLFFHVSLCPCIVHYLLSDA